MLVIMLKLVMVGKLTSMLTMKFDLKTEDFLVKMSKTNSTR